MAEILLYHKLLEFPLFLGMKHKDIMELVAHTRFGFMKEDANKTIVEADSPCDSIIMLAERIIKTRQTEQLMQEQNDFEQNEIAARDRQLLYVIISVAAPLLIIFFIMMAYSKRKERMKEE